MSLQKKAQEDRTSEKVGTPIRLWDFSSAWPRHLKTSLFCISCLAGMHRDAAAVNPPARFQRISLSFLSTVWGSITLQVFLKNLNFQSRFICFMYLGVLPSCVGLCTTYMSGALRGQKRTLNLLGLELQTVLSHHMGAGNLTLVLWKNSQCF